MSKATKRKHVLNEAMRNYFQPPTEEQDIVRIVNSRGNNLHEVETPSKECYLVSMPTKFRKNIWVKRGDFVIVEPIAEGDKVKAEMVRVLSKEHIKYFKKINVWPREFEIRVGDTYEQLNNGMTHLQVSSDENSVSEATEEETSSADTESDETTASSTTSTSDREK